MTESATGAERRSRSIIGAGVAMLVALLARIPYALVALIDRLVMARVFFVAGQARIEGPQVPVHIPSPTGVPLLDSLPALDFVITLPRDLNPATVAFFETHYANLPLSPTLAAWILAYAEFVLPICLVIGFATRFAALALLILTVLIEIYGQPGLWWPAHVYWVSLLLFLIAPGPGAISIDAVIRTLYRREQAPVQ